METISLFNRTAFVTAAQDYFFSCLAENGKFNPIASFFNSDNRIFDIFFPDASEEFTRDQQFSSFAFINGSFNCSFVTLVIDSTINIRVNGEDTPRDALVCLIADNHSCAVFVDTYSFNRETKSLVWLKDEIKELPASSLSNSVVTSLASQFFLAKNQVVWQYFKEWLTSKGFVFSPTPDFSEDAVSFIAEISSS